KVLLLGLGPTTLALAGIASGVLITHCVIAGMVAIGSSFACLVSSGDCFSNDYMKVNIVFYILCLFLFIMVMLLNFYCIDDKKVKIISSFFIVVFAIIMIVSIIRKKPI